MSTTQFRVRAAFSFNGGRSWEWFTWTDKVGAGNKHFAIISKAKALGANAWEFGNADYAEASRASF